MSYPFKTFTPATNRTGIPDAVAVVVDRHVDGARTTSIVAPPRYGKSDIIRLSAVELLQTGRATAALCLAPWDNIADQMVSATKTRPMVLRYMSGANRKAMTPDVFRAHRLARMSDAFHETSDLTHLFTATVQLVKNYQPIVTRWVQRCMEYGERPIVFIDEGHYLSTVNEWGKVSQWVQDAGGHVVLLTGTKWRADNEQIPGFNTRLGEVSDKILTTATRLDDNRVKKTKWLATQSIRELIPDYEVTIKDAWEVKALCKLEAHWVDIKVQNIGGQDDCMLSELKKSRAVSLLRKAVTHPDMIAEVMKKAVTDMRERRNAGKANSAMLVITASDISSEDTTDDISNYHARRVRDALRQIDDTLDVSIATQASEDGDKKANAAKGKIKRFCGYEYKGEEVLGAGDVLIVKNMGTVGLDCPRIKTLVMLGTARQISTWIQSILRCGTTWEGVEFATIVMPQDIMGVENWNFLVAGEGGEHTNTTKELIEDSIEDQKAEDKPEDVVTLTDAEFTHAQDSHSTETVVGDDVMSTVHQAIAKFPILRERMSVVEIRGLIESGVLDVSGVVPGDDVGVVDTGEECKVLAFKLEQLAKEYASVKAPYGRGQTAWTEAKRDISKSAKRASRMRCKPSEETDPSLIRKAVAHVEEKLAMMRGR